MPSTRARENTSLTLSFRVCVYVLKGSLLKLNQVNQKWLMKSMQILLHIRRSMKNILFVVYDIGNIRDEAELYSDIEKKRGHKNCDYKTLINNKARNFI
jgi:hypothetical protein